MRCPRCGDRSTRPRRTFGNRLARALDLLVSLVGLRWRRRRWVCRRCFHQFHAPLRDVTACPQWGALEVLEAEGVDGLAKMRAARQERLRLGAAPEAVDVMSRVLMGLGPAERCAMCEFYLHGLDGPEAAAKSGLTAEEFREIRATVRKTFFATAQRPGK
jgi:hypothetical protein